MKFMPITKPIGRLPEDLVPQFPLVRDAVRAFNIPAVEEGFEADDLIATYAEEAAKPARG